MYVILHQMLVGEESIYGRMAGQWLLGENGEGSYERQTLTDV
jgi:hypothetical protein